MNAITIPGGTPAHILKRQQAKISRVAAAMAMPDVDELGDRLSIRGGVFRVMREGVETEAGPTVDVVVVGANPKLSKTYYAKNYDPTGPLVAPDCFSDDGVTPNDGVSAKQHHECASCPHNAWGSSTSNTGKGKSCRDSKRLAVVLSSDSKLSPLLLTILPTSLKSLAGYQKELTNHGLSPENVLTRLSLDSTPGYSTVRFAFGGFLPDSPQLFEALDKIIEADDTARMIGTLRKPVLELVKEETPVPAIVRQPDLFQQAAAPVIPAAPAPAFAAFSKPAEPVAGVTMAPAPTPAPAPVTIEQPPQTVDENPGGALAALASALKEMKPDG